MVVENLPTPILEWLASELPFLCLKALLIALSLLVISFLIQAFRYGPGEGGDTVFKFVRGFFIDLVNLSPRRILALAWLAIQESIRRRVWIVFLLFVIILMFAGWFLDPGSRDPSTLYLSFVLTWTTWLILLLGLFLSAFSLPADIKSRTIYTIVTKPVRPGEIVLGRIVGFSMIGTVLLGVMGLVSYFFVIRVLDHTHEVEVASLVDASVTDPTAGKIGRASLEHNHRHTVRVDEQGNGYAEPSQGHSHQITAKTVDGKTTYVMSGPQGMLNARSPVYGNLRFLERDGKPGKGISVGYEWAYRRYLEGGTQAAAVWTFHDVTPERYPNGLPIEMTIRVFRTYKGDVQKGILGSIKVKNPSTGRTSAAENFTAKDATIDSRHIDVKLKGSEGEPLDLFKDLVTADGTVEIWIECLERAQYYGVALPDLYLRAENASFRVNFVKAYLGIWFQLVLVVSFGVMFSTLLSGPVAMMGTISALLVGFFTKFVFELASGKAEGGGPIESLVRIVKQQNMVTKLDQTLGNVLMQKTDYGLMQVLAAFASLVPDFTLFTNVSYVAHGFDVPADLVLHQAFVTMTYVLVAFVVGYFFLKSREVAR